MKKFDLIIIGAGPGGYVAAVRARQLGLSTAIFEKNAIGGTCLNIGCIPTKSLLHSSELADRVKKASDEGIDIKEYKLNYKKAFERSRKVVEYNVKGVESLFKKHGVVLINDEACFDSANTIRAKQSSETYEAKYFLIAAGSTPKIIPGFERDGTTILDSTDMLLSDTMPKSIIILGAGAIGVKFRAF